MYQYSEDDGLLDLEEQEELVKKAMIHSKKQGYAHLPPVDIARYPSEEVELTRDDYCKYAGIFCNERIIDEEFGEDTYFE